MIYDIAIIGGGIVGLSTAMNILQQKKLSVVVLEAEDKIAQHQTGNNSGVIHSGIYYKPNSLKAKNCTEGREAMYRFCQEHDIQHERCGKIIVATDLKELPTLQNIEERGQANGLKGIKRLNQDTIKEYEPHVTGIAGLYVPDTGIINYKQVCQKYAQIITEKGGNILTNHKVLNIKQQKSEIIVQTKQAEIKAKFLINCAGLQSDRIAQMCGLEPKMKIVPFRGEYYELVPEKHYLIKNLVYPVPDPEFPFLGVHFTRMVTGGIEAGPNAVLALKREGYKHTDIKLADIWDTFTYGGFWRMAQKHWYMGMYEVYRSLSKHSFLKALQRLLPELTINDIHPGGAGVRAQALLPNGQMVDDFFILEHAQMIHVLNAPSPAATSSLSIGKSIAEKYFKFNT